MEIFSIIICVSSILANIILFVKLFKLQERLSNALASNSAFKEKGDNFNHITREQDKKIGSLEQHNAELLIYKGRFEEASAMIGDLKNQINKNKEELLKYNQKILGFEKENSLLAQEKENLKTEKSEWNDKKQSILLELSEELIKKNNLQQDNFGKKQKEVIEKTVSDLNQKFTNILNKVSSLDDDVKKTFEDISFTKNALLSPGGAGKVAEITLENILQASGLKQKQRPQEAGDFILQSHYLDQNNKAKRPDAMVFLPKDHILIIDSKSSSHFLELQQSLDREDNDNKKEVEAKIKESMKRHLEDLKKRNYANAKLEELDLKGLEQTHKEPIITTIMFLQTEKMLDTIRQLDANFERKALEAKILILSPVGLINLLNQVKFIVDNLKQEKNIEQLKIEIRKLIDSVSTMFKKSESMGTAIKRSLNSYNEFVGTFNSRFLPRINNMNKLGIETENKNVNQKLPKIGFDGGLIEVETKEDI